MRPYWCDKRRADYAIGYGEILVHWMRWELNCGESGLGDTYVQADCRKAKSTSSIAVDLRGTETGRR